ncbi:MAG: Pyrimidine-nucleoside phosphorylase [Ignavibacteriaceae bacterium]|nr:Pyrimidine-nucleoside phosphorylase [Ignavibacteriaceae bacterium]
MNIVELIKKKRDGKIFKDDEINYLISNYTNGNIPDYQFSALLMTILLKGMNSDETSALTNSMLNSGKILNLSSLKGYKIDKHSTGGVGDKTSLIIAPIVASTGIFVPMISGRGLGHTGGTLDKLESIPGFRTDLSLSNAISVLKKCGAILIGQTKEIAPADKMIYALRDVTATVESIPLITASIMSKKLAEGINGLVLDIKTGNGAFMKSQKDSVELANSLINTAKSFDKKVIAFITDMNQPLGNYVGNWLEVYESIHVLRGEIKNDLSELSIKLAGAMIYLGKKAKSIQDGEKIASKKIENGEAFKKFVEIVKLQGGEINYIDNPDQYPKSIYIQKIKSVKRGYIEKINTYNIGMASLVLGAGRKTKEDKIDPKAGIVLFKKIGDYVNKGDIICELHSDSKSKIKSAEDIILRSIKFSNTKPTLPKLIKKVIE